MVDTEYCPWLVRQYSDAVREGDEQVRINIPGVRFGAVEAVSADIDHFLYFLKRERELLVQSGMDSDVAEWIISRVKERIADLRQGAPREHEVETALKYLRDGTCSQARRLVAALRGGWWKQVLLEGFGGLALISVNIAASGGTLSAIGVAASAGIGGGLITQAAKDVLPRL